MTKFEMVVQMVMQRLEDERSGIENSCIEQLLFDMRFKPHGGPPRSVKLQLLHSYEGTPINGTSGARPAPAKA